MGTLTVTADELHAALARYDAEAVPGTLHTGRYRLRYVSWGTGPQTLVIIHGLADTARAFAAMMVNLVADFRCIAYELPNGCGDDAKIAAYRHADYAHDLLALLDHLNLETVNLLGSSFGNTVAVRATTLYPTRFRRVVLKSGFSRRPLDRWQRMLCRPARYWPGLMGDVPPVAAVMRRLEGPGFASAAPAALDFLLRNTGQAPIRTVARRALLLDTLDLRPLLPSIRQPVLLVGGDRDRLAPRCFEDELAAGLANVRRVEFAPCGHYPQYTHPRQLAEVIRAFLVE